MHACQYVAGHSAYIFCLTMITEIIKGGGIERAAQIIKAGGVVAFPTETVYGLGANAFDERAVAEIYRAKGRPQDNPLICHIASVEDVSEVAAEVPDLFFSLAGKFMPGPLTVVLKKGNKIPYAVTAGMDSVAVRMPDNPTARALIKACGCPLAAPSANASKHVSPTTAMHVYDDLNGRIPLILDGGECRVGIESTVLSLVTPVPTILRPGAVTEEMLSEVLGEVKTHTGRIIAAAPAPGMKYKHYAPRCRAVLAQDVKDALNLYRSAESEGLKPVFISAGRIPEFDGLNVINMGRDEEAAARIYAALRDAEKAYDYIIVQKLDGGGVEKSVMNRIFKATANEE